NPSDSLRRDGAVATILQQTPTPLVDSEVCQGLPTQRRLPSFRSDSGTLVRDHGWLASHQQDRDLTIQPCLSLAAGAGTLSRPIHAPSLSQTASTQGYPSTRGLARPTTGGPVSDAQAQNHLDLRSGFGAANPLWPLPDG